MAFAVPTRALNSRKVVVSTKDLTLDARFTIASELRQQAVLLADIMAALAAHPG